jgi:hypothetical protein
VNLINREQVLKVGLQFRGNTGSPTVSSIIARARIRWRAVDTKPPVLTPIAGGRPFGGLSWLTRDTGAEVDLVADDNTDVAGQGIALGGRGVGPDTAALPDGRTRVDVVACDIAQNCSTAGFDARVDTNPPAASMSASRFAVARPEIPVQATDPTKDGFASGLAGADLALLNVDESVFDVDVRRTDAGFALTPRAPVPEGLYSATLRVRDVAGNQLELPVPEFVVDLAPPSVRPVSPPPRSRLAASPSEIKAAVSDAVRVDAATLQLDGLTREAPFAPGDEEVVFTPGRRICPGSHTARVAATDAVGRTSAATWRFSVRGRMTRACRRERRCTAARARVERARKRLATAQRRGGRRRVRSARRSLSRQLRLARRACR